MVGISNLERRGHEGVVHPGLGEEGEVDVKATDVDHGRNCHHERGAGNKLLDEL